MRREEDLTYRRIPKPWLVWLLWFFLGWNVGAHRFYFAYCSRTSGHIIRGALITATCALFILLNRLYALIYEPCPQPGFPPCFIENSVGYRTLWVLDWLLFSYFAIQWVLDGFFNGTYIRLLTPKKEVTIKTGGDD